MILKLGMPIENTESYSRLYVQLFTLVIKYDEPHAEKAFKNTQKQIIEINPSS